MLLPVLALFRVLLPVFLIMVPERFQRVVQSEIIPVLGEIPASNDKTRLSKLEQLKTIIEAWGMDPKKILSREALAIPHRTVIDSKRRQIEVLNQALKQAIIMELQENTKAVH